MDQVQLHSRGGGSASGVESRAFAGTLAPAARSHSHEASRGQGKEPPLTQALTQSQSLTQVQSAVTRSLDRSPPHSY